MINKNLETNKPINLETNKPINLETNKPINLETNKPINLETNKINKPKQSLKNITFFKDINIIDCKSQRSKEWDDVLYNDFINSIFEYIPTGQIILNYITKDDHYEIIDGQHRINIIKMFMSNEIPYKINSDIYLYKDLDLKLKTIFDSTELFTVIYENLSDNAIIKLYLTINAGVEQNDDHITTLLSRDNSYQNYISYLEFKYKNINKITLLRIFNICTFITYEYETLGMNNVKFKQLSKTHFKTILNKINVELIKKSTKIFDIIILIVSNYNDLTNNNLTNNNLTNNNLTNNNLTNNVYTFLTHRIILDLDPYFKHDDVIIENYRNKIELLSTKNNINLHEMFKL